MSYFISHKLNCDGCGCEHTNSNVARGWATLTEALTSALGSGWRCHEEIGQHWCPSCQHCNSGEHPILSTGVCARCGTDLSAQRRHVLTREFTGPSGAKLDLTVTRVGDQVTMQWATRALKLSNTFTIRDTAMIQDMLVRIMAPKDCTCREAPNHRGWCASVNCSCAECRDGHV